MGTSNRAGAQTRENGEAAPAKSKGGLAHKGQGTGDGYRVTHTLEGAGRRPATRGGVRGRRCAICTGEGTREREERRIMNRTEEGDEKAPVLCPPAAMA